MSFIRYAAAALLATATAAQAETLRFSSFEPPQAYITQNVLTAWAEDVSKASEGTLDVKIFVGGTLGRAPDQQLKLVGVVVSAPNFIASRRKINEPEDMKGINFRGPGPVLLNALKALEAVPIGGMTGSNLADAISRGLVEGTSDRMDGGRDLPRHRSNRSLYDRPLGATPMLVLMNKARYDAQPEKARAVIDQHSGAAFSERFGKTFDAYMVASRKRAEDRKATITDITGEAAARWSMR